MKIKERKIKGVFEIHLEPNEDSRGFFMRTYDDKIFKKNGIDDNWVQENQSFSKKKGTLRGLHFQHPPYTESKIVRAISGEIFIAFVDLRKNSPSLGKWDSIVISAENKKMLYVREGFALGMCTLSNDCTLLYKMGNYYKPDCQGTIKWDDSDIGIKWPVEKPIISERDKKATTYKEFEEKYGGLKV
jgi:dTDP-4-dehydrorhamnose 3,5-epimerase